MIREFSPADERRQRVAALARSPLCRGVGAGVVVVVAVAVAVSLATAPDDDSARRPAPQTEYTGPVSVATQGLADSVESQIVLPSALFGMSDEEAAAAAAGGDPVVLDSVAAFVAELNRNGAGHHDIDVKPQSSLFSWELDDDDVGVAEADFVFCKMVRVAADGGDPAQLEVTLKGNVLLDEVQGDATATAQLQPRVAQMLALAAAADPLPSTPAQVLDVKLKTEVDTFARESDGAHKVGVSTKLTLTDRDAPSPAPFSGYFADAGARAGLASTAAWNATSPPADQLPPNRVYELVRAFEVDRVEYLGVPLGDATLELRYAAADDALPAVVEFSWRLKKAPAAETFDTRQMGVSVELLQLLATVFADDTRR